MSMVNEIRLLGNLGTEVQSNMTSSGRPVANFRLATNEVFMRDGQKQTHTEWHRVVIWGKLAETCSQYLKKGQQVMLTGRLRTRNWTDKEGNTRYSTEVHANQVQFLSRPKAPTVTEEEAVEEVAAPQVQEVIPF